MYRSGKGRKHNRKKVKTVKQERTGNSENEYKKADAS